MAVALALLSSILGSGVDFAGGVLSKTRPAALVIACSQTLGLLLLSLWIVAFSVDLELSSAIGPGIAAGLCLAAALGCFYTALSRGTMGVVASIASLGAVVPVVYGVSQGEQISGLQGGGIAVALVGCAMASNAELKVGGGVMALVLAAGAAAGFGGTMLFVANGAGHGIATMMFSMKAVMSGVSLAAVSAWWLVREGTRFIGPLQRRDVRTQQGRVFVLSCVGIAIGDLGANLTFALASQRAPLSIVSVLGSLHPVATVVLARLFLNQTMSRRQVIGVVCMVTGVLVLTSPTPG